MNQCDGFFTKQLWLCKYSEKGMIKKYFV